MSHDVLGCGVRQVGDRAHRLMRVDTDDDQVDFVGAGELQNPFCRESKLDEVIRMRQKFRIGWNQVPQPAEQQIGTWFGTHCARMALLQDVK